MRDLSMHVLDIVQNSIRAGASLVSVEFVRSPNGQMTLTITDDGCGMDAEFLARVTDPFTTTRTTRKVGLGLPMLRQSAEMSGGSLHIESEPGKGTRLIAVFNETNIDCIPMGDMCETLFTLPFLNPLTPDFLFRAEKDGAEASFDTRQAREILGGIPLNEPDVAAWMKDSIFEEFQPVLETPPN